MFSKMITDGYPIIIPSKHQMYGAMLMHSSRITGRAFNFDGGVSANKPFVDLGKPAVTANIFDGGGEIVFTFTANSDGEGNSGRLIDKAQYSVYASSENLGFTKFSFNQSFSGANAGYATGFVVALGHHTRVSIKYNNSVANDPSIFLMDITAGEVVYTEYSVSLGNLTKMFTPSGTRTSDASSSAYIGNNSSKTRTLDGYIYDVRLYDSELSTADRNLARDFKDTTQTPVQWISCQDTPDDEPNVIVGTDYDMTGAGNWLNYGLSGMDVNSTVANRLWMQGDGSLETAYIIGVPFLGGYKAGCDMRLKSGVAQAMDIGNYSSGLVLADSFAINPTSTEQTFNGFLNCTEPIFTIGSSTGFSGKEYEMGYPFLKRLLATDSIAGNDGIIWVQGSTFFAEGVQTWV